jgi:hypothetical protein
MRPLVRFTQRLATRKGRTSAVIKGRLGNRTVTVDVELGAGSERWMLKAKLVILTRLLGPDGIVHDNLWPGARFVPGDGRRFSRSGGW